MCQSQFQLPSTQLGRLGSDGYPAAGNDSLDGLAQLYKGVADLTWL